MKKPNYSLDDAVAAVNKAKLKYSPDKIKEYFKNFVSDKRSMSTKQYLTYIKERIKDPSIPHKENWNKPLMGSPLEVKGFGKRKNVRVSDLIEAEKQLSDDELRLWRAYTKKQQKKVKFARKVEGERIDPVTGDVIKDPEVRSNWLAQAYIRKGIRRAKKSNAYKQLSPLERLKLEFFEKRLDVMGNIIKENPALLKNKEVMKLLETGVNAKTGKIIKSPVDFSQIKDRRVWELEHIDPIKSGQTKMRGSFLSNLQVLPQSVHKNFKDPAEKFLNANWGKKEYANEINEILKQAQELKVTLRVKDVGPVGYKATFENFLDKADDVFNLYVRDSGAKKLYSETIAEMKPANIKFNWKILGFKEAPSEEIIQKAITETTRPAFQGIKDAVLLSIPAAGATEAATADTLEPSDEKQEAGVAGAIAEHPYLSGAAGIGAGTAITKYGAWNVAKALGRWGLLYPLAASAVPFWQVTGAGIETVKAALEKRFPDYKLDDWQTWMHGAFWDWGIKTFGLDKMSAAFGGTFKTLSKMDQARVIRNVAARGLLSPKAVKFVSKKIAWPVTAGLAYHDLQKWAKENVRKEPLTIEEQKDIQTRKEAVPKMLDTYEQASQIAKEQNISYEDALKLVNKPDVPGINFEDKDKEEVIGVNRYTQLIK